MTKKKLSFSIALAVSLLAALVVACMIFGACGAKTYNVVWNVDPKATVTDIKVDGEELTELPLSVEEGKTLTFKLTTASGYSVDKVTGASLRSGVYTLKVSKDTEIKVTTKKDVLDLTVTGFDNTKQYFVGDNIDLEGVTVTAKYVDGDVAVTNYTVSTTVFAGGETSVTFSFGGKEQTFEIPVVEYKVTIDLDGGTLKDELKAVYEQAAEDKVINNYSVGEKGVITFTYINLTKSLKLPTGDDIEKQYYGFIRFDGDSVKTLTATSAQSISMTAVWEYQPVIVEEVKMEAREETVSVEGEDGESSTTVTKPYLIITGKFNGATAARLYLKEGNVNVNLYGPTIEKADDSDDFTLEFDLTQLSARADCNGKWMDIRFNATVEGKEESMPLHITDPASFTVDLSTKLRVGGYNYLFATYTNNNDTTLKVYYNDTFYEYSVTIDDTDKANPLLVLEGKMLNDTYNGGKITVSWWITSESPVDEGAIDEEGNFRVEIALADIPTGSNGYAHVKIEGKEGSEVPVYGGNSTNLVHAGSTTDFPALDKKVGEITNAIRYEAESGTAYYVGYAWEGLMIYARSEKVLLDSATLAKDGEEGAEKVYLVLNGKYSKTAYATAEEAKEAIETDLKFDAQTIGDYSTVTAEYTPEVIANEDGTFAIRVEMQSVTAGKTVFFHKCFGFNGETSTSGNNLGTSAATPKIGDTVTAGGLTYTIGDASTLSDSWQKSLIIVNVTAAE